MRVSKLVLFASYRFHPQIIRIYIPIVAETLKERRIVMNERFHTNQRILPGLAFCFAIAVVLCSEAIAQQLEPNPNPPGNTIIIDSWSVQGDDLFDNFGIINIMSTGEIYHHWGSGSGSGLNPTINNFGTIDNDGIITNKALVNNEAYIDNDGTILTQNGLFYNTSTGFIDNSGIILNEARTENFGIINNLSTGRIINQGRIINSGTIYNDGNILGGRIDNLSTGIIVNDGTLDMFNFFDTFDNQGTLKGTGTFIGDLLNDSGTVAPGNSPGTMTIDGDFTLDGSGILDIEIGGFTPGSFDFLNVTGTAFLPGGNINFSFLSGYDIVADVGPGQSWKFSFLEAGDIHSIFDPAINFNFPSLPYFQFDVFRQDKELVFEATNTVPLPPAIILGGIGLAFASWKLRRRKEL
jgi:hypothetical protein